MSMDRALSYISNKVSGFSNNTLKIQPSSKNSGIKAGEYSRFPLPSNSLVNTRSLKMHFDCTVTGTTARLPPGLSSLINRLEVTCGGATISQGTNLYSVLVNAKKALCGTKDNKQSGNPELVRNVDEFSGLGIINAVAQPSPSASAYTGSLESPFCIDNFENSFFGSCEPYILDMGLLADCAINVYWNDNSVLTTSTTVGAGGADEGAALTAVPGTGFTQAVSPPNGVYEINGLFMTVECVNLSDDSLDKMVASQMASVGFLEIPFKDYYCDTQSAAGGNIRFDVATQSLDRIHVGFRYSGTTTVAAAATGRQYNLETQGPPIPVLGYSPNPPMTTRHSSTQNKYTTAQQCFRCPGPDFALQWVLNGSVVPQTPVFGSELMAFSKTQIYDEIRDDLTAAEYLSSSFVGCVRLCMPESTVRTRSGLDTRSSNLQALIRTTGGTPGNYQAFTACETTSILRVMPGRASGVIP